MSNSIWINLFPVSATAFPHNIRIKKEEILELERREEQGEGRPKMIQRPNKMTQTHFAKQNQEKGHKTVIFCFKDQHGTPQLTNQHFGQKNRRKAKNGRRNGPPAAPPRVPRAERPRNDGKRVAPRASERDEVKRCPLEAVL